MITRLLTLNQCAKLINVDRSQLRRESKLNGFPIGIDGKVDCDEVLVWRNRNIKIRKERERPATKDKPYVATTVPPPGLPTPPPREPVDELADLIEKLLYAFGGVSCWLDERNVPDDPPTIFKAIVEAGFDEDRAAMLLLAQAVRHAE